MKLESRNEGLRYDLTINQQLCQFFSLSVAFSLFFTSLQKALVRFFRQIVTLQSETLCDAKPSTFWTVSNFQMV